MKLLRCPKGLIGTRIQHKKVYIDSTPLEERGYTILEDQKADELAKRDGFEIIDVSDYPRDLDKLIELLRGLRQLPRTATKTSVNTIPSNFNLCWWCRFRYWFQNRLRKNKA